MNELWELAPELERFQDALSVALEKAALTLKDDPRRAHFRRVAEEIGVDFDEISAKLGLLIGR